MKPPLPPGVWIKLLRVANSVTPEEIAQLFLDRMGVELPLDRIWSDDTDPGTYLISLGGEHYTAILNWAFSEDLLGNRPVKIISCNRITKRVLDDPNEW
jgi:hypothetical protein